MERRERQKEGGLVGEMEGAGDWERQRARETCQLQSGEAGFTERQRERERERKGPCAKMNIHRHSAQSPRMLCQKKLQLTLFTCSLFVTRKEEGPVICAALRASTACQVIYSATASRLSLPKCLAEEERVRARGMGRGGRGRGGEVEG